MKKIMTLLFLTVNIVAFAQDSSSSFLDDPETPYIDTVNVVGNGFQIMHFHDVSRETRQQLIMDTSGFFLDNVRNKKSRLIFTSEKGSFDIPTVPLTSVLYLKNIGLVLALSKIVASPFHILLYNLNGELVCKRSLTSFEMKVKKRGLGRFVKKFPYVRNCINQGTIITKTDSYYFIEESNCILDHYERKELRNSGYSVFNHATPIMYSAGPGYTGFRYAKYEPSFSDKNPLDSLIMDGSSPKAIILNFEKGRKVELPLKSNCDIDEEIR